ncbi:SRPBCC domain-containing protein [Haloarcula onubensis]|uniref:SRPBCC domain-containing protein n=1 Tax=Haloarcula onubensis TaxID=2950539 RepID=A0ABU2FQQ0_9EURY|nr:SRPBCC domain-containing protein [Halomicroarcula sp. S3CR25-11]MDS0283085.1 SRPBCC domain-containing protein [Halomicroarcula sp. S3CR25-11]
MSTIYTSIDIAATPKRIWETLIDFGAYTEWNPFILTASGAAAEGERLHFNIRPPNGRELSFRPRVTAVVPGQRLEWVGRLGVRGVFDGRHEFRIEPLEDGLTRLHHSETFPGVLVGVLLHEGSIRSGFRAMNTALKERVERKPAAPNSVNGSTAGA